MINNVGFFNADVHRKLPCETSCLPHKDQDLGEAGVIFGYIVMAGFSAVMVFALFGCYKVILECREARQQEAIRIERLAQLNPLGDPVAHLPQRVDYGDDSGSSYPSHGTDKQSTDEPEAPYQIMNV